MDENKFMIKKIRLRKIIIFVVFFIISAALFLIWFLFTPIYFETYEEIPDSGLLIEYEDGITSFWNYVSTHNTGTINDISHGIQYIDYKNGVIYDVRYLLIWSTRFGMWYYPGSEGAPFYSLNDNGKDSTNAFLITANENGEEQKFTSRTGRVYYGRRDSEGVLLWEYAGLQEGLENGTIKEFVSN